MDVANLIWGGRNLREKTPSLTGGGEGKIKERRGKDEI